MKSADLPLVDFTLDGERVQAVQGQTILQAARRVGVDIPHLCYQDGMRADGNCRACVVEVAGERVLAPSCSRAVTPGMEVKARSERALKSQQMVVEMLLADLPEQGYKWNDEVGGPATPADRVGQHGELSLWADRLGVAPRPELVALRREQPAADLSHPAMAVNLDACIQCTRCVRACREVQVNDVIGYAQRGSSSRIVFDLGDPMGASTCVACGECVQACPTGALMPKTMVGSQAVDRKVDSVCPFCGVGCLVTYQIRDEKIVAVEGRNGPANEGRLCVKGRFGFDYAHHPQRLVRPLIRKPGVPKDPSIAPDPAHWGEVFREASWEEALDFAAGGLKRLRDTHGRKALAGFGSAKGSNEEAYLFQKLVRTGFGSNNVDHCTRLCHASSVAALLEGVGSGAVSNPVRDVEKAHVILVIGSNPTSNHPVAATWMKNAAKRGTRLVLADPRVTDIGRHAWRILQFKPGSDVAMLNALIHVVIEEGLADQAFVRERAANFEALRENVKGYSPEAMESVCGVPAQTLREVARAFATAEAAMILWGMGVSQHVHGTDNARCLIALASITGQVGKPGSGLHPLRGQNNVQGASDAGLIPMMFPNYQRVDDPQAHRWFEDFWGLPLDDAPGYTVVEIMHKALAPDSDPHRIRGMYIMGENPAMSDPDLNHARQALAALDHLVVQDIFMTETAWLADVVLPASAWPEKTGTVSNTDRMVQLGRRALTPPGEAKPDLWIIQELARRIGLDWDYPGEDSGVAAVYEEMRQAMHASIAGISWERLQHASSVTYPCLSEDDPGQPVVFTERFPTADGRVKLVPAAVVPPDERPDAQFPFVLITGRQLEHWHTGSMTRRAAVLDAIEPMATASMNGADLQALGLQPGDVATVRSRRGEVTLHLRRDDGTPAGAVFIPFAYYEAAANLMTNPALDPFGKIPEFKYCAVQVEPGGTPRPAAGYGTGAVAA
ncbi:formate dehydrogenase subunit alpha [Ramlibacter sp.]|uniref:formate dehydrogenase subunit alpha n=1 Tax=Ramlibacter sp. TaxID=1917967 RepID=UPI002D764863|nr:formate dehydrogenase subunit alpha [Ramlibacter sp.]HYD77704.1 formate dehydrogenase subunit alpha [Ramlibacter sp.]